MIRAAPFTAALALCIAFVPAAPLFAQPAPEFASGWIDKKPVESRRFMVAAANPLATDAGYAVLRAGGNAVDAAIAVQLVLGLVEPQSSGLGGGAFLLYHDARSHKLLAYDGRETAPAAATPERFLGADGQPMAFYDAVIGGRSVGVPGTVKLLETLHRRHGKLPWPRLFERAVALAENGFPISPRLHALVAAETHWSQPRAHDYFVAPDGNARAIGSTLANPAYARTLRTLAAQGAKPFYEGAIADDIVRTVREAPRNPGDMTRGDLARYAVKVRSSYRGYRVCGMPPP
jgi:gamma-glutamyltranspeptidase/glutathione hydrolase